MMCEHLPGGFLVLVQQLLVSPNTLYHQDFELPPVQPVDFKIKKEISKWPAF